MELANAYTELNDPDLQEKLFETQLEALLQVRRASPLRVMVPMVSSVEEVEDGIARRGLVVARGEVNEESSPLVEDPGSNRPRRGRSRGTGHRP